MYTAFLGVFAKQRKMTISFVMSVRLCLSAWKNTAVRRRVFIKFDISVFFRNYVEKTRV